MTTDPRDQLIDFPHAAAETSDLLRYLKVEQQAEQQEPDSFARRTHALRVALLQREIAVRNRRATVAIDEASKERVREVVAEAVRELCGLGPYPPSHELCQAVATRVAEQYLVQRDQVNAELLAQVEILRDQLAIAGDHRDTYRGRAETLGREVSRLADLVEVLRCGDLVTFADGELPEDRAVAFRDHLGRCAACRRDLEDSVEMDARLSELAKSRVVEAAERNMRALELLAPDHQPVAAEQETAIAPLSDDWLADCARRAAESTLGDVVSMVPALLTEIMRLKLAAGGAL